MALNLVYLGFVVLIPFSSDVLGQPRRHLGRGDHLRGQPLDREPARCGDVPLRGPRRAHHRALRPTTWRARCDCATSPAGRSSPSRYRWRCLARPRRSLIWVVLFFVPGRDPARTSRARRGSGRARRGGWRAAARPRAGGASRRLLSAISAGTGVGPPVLVQRHHRQVGGRGVAHLAAARVLGLDPDPDLHRGGPGRVHLRPAGDQLGDVDRADEGHPVHRRGDDAQRRSGGSRRSPPPRRRAASRRRRARTRPRWRPRSPSSGPGSTPTRRRASARSTRRCYPARQSTLARAPARCARWNTSSSIGSVSLPVKVFCWLGW